MSAFAVDMLTVLESYLPNCRTRRVATGTLCVLILMPGFATDTRRGYSWSPNDSLFCSLPSGNYTAKTPSHDLPTYLQILL